MNRGHVAWIIFAVGLVALLYFEPTVLEFFFVPAIEPLPYACMGGLACIRYFAPSCVAFGFGSYTIYSGRYFLTWHCPA